MASCPVTGSPQAGRFVPSAICSLTTGDCEPLPTTTTFTTTTSSTSASTAATTATSTTTTLPSGPCQIVQAGDRTLCRGTCPMTGDECRALGFRGSCACQPITTFEPCTCLATSFCSAQTAGCKEPDEICTIPGGDPRFDRCEPGDCQCVPQGQ